jgi:hypothetical protein
VIEPGQVTAIVPTRGNVDMSLILTNLEEQGYGEIIIADNSKLPVDLGIYARFQACYWAKHDVIYTNDDDVVFQNHADLLALYKPDVLVSAYPQNFDIPWISTGAVFDRALVKPAFDKYLQHYPFDEFLTHKAADAVFALLTPFEVHPMPYVELPWATADGRVHTSPNWYDRDRPEARARCLAIR